MKELPEASEAFMERDSIKEAYRSLLEKAYSQKVPNLRDSASLFDHSGKLVGTAIRIGGKVHGTILPQEFMEGKEEAWVVQCQCLEECQKDGRCIPQLGPGGILCISDKCMGSTRLKTGSVKEVLSP